MTDEDLIARLLYIAAVLEANREKFAVPDHIGAKAETIREAASRFTTMLAERDAALVEAARRMRDMVEQAIPCNYGHQTLTRADILALDPTSIKDQADAG